MRWRPSPPSSCTPAALLVQPSLFLLGTPTPGISNHYTWYFTRYESNLWQIQNWTYDTFIAQIKAQNSITKWQLLINVNWYGLIYNWGENAQWRKAEEQKEKMRESINTERFWRTQVRGDVASPGGKLAEEGSGRETPRPRHPWTPWRSTSSSTPSTRSSLE